MGLRMSSSFSLANDGRSHMASNFAICLVNGEIERIIRRKLASFRARRGSQGWIKGREAGTGATRSARARDRRTNPIHAFL